MADGTPVIFSASGRPLTGVASIDQAADLLALGQKAGELDTLDRSVVAPRTDITRPGLDSFIIFVTGLGSEITQWGQNVKLRDRQLRDFITAEHYFNSALGIVTARNAALDWKITGDERTAEAAQEMVNNADFGLGWEHFATTVSIDLYTQDNGAYVELIREAESPEAPVVGFNQLDSARCFQTGNPQVPVLYEDREGQMHQLRWFQVVHLMETPASMTSGSSGYFSRLQYCALTRALGGVEILKSLTQYKSEKIGGRNVRAIHLLSGVTAEQVQDAIQRSNILADSQGNQQFVQPPMVGNVDPAATVSHDTIEMASLPDGFSEKESTEAYLIMLAMAFLTDVQEFAPLQGGNIGTGQQSQTLHQKSRGKGSGLWQSLITRLMNLHGVLPQNVEFEFAEQDLEAEALTAEIKLSRSNSRSIRVASGELTIEGARQTALDDGDLSEELFEHMQQEDEASAERDESAARIAELEGMMGMPPEGGGGPTPIRRDLTPAVAVEGDEQTPQSGLRSVTPEGYVGARPREKALGAVPFGKLITGRLHRAYATTADDASSLGYFDDTDERKLVGQAIGPALRVFEDDLRESGVYDILIEADDADRIVEASIKALGIGVRQATETDPQRRAGPDEERLAFEAEVGEEIAEGLGSIRRRINARLREAARAVS